MRPDYYILLPDHTVQQCDLMTWAAAFERRADRRLKQEVVGDYWVSTVFVGLDHQYGIGPPLLFETLVAHGDGDGPRHEPGKSVELDGKKIDLPAGGIRDVHRAMYSTYDQAMEGHAAVVRRISEGWRLED